MTLFTLQGTAQKQERKDLPNGKYIAKVVEAIEGTTMKGMPKITVELEIIDGDFKGYRIMYNTMTIGTDYGDNMLSGLLYACKFDEGTDFNDLKEICQALEGKIILAEIAKTKSGNGYYPRAKWYEQTDFIEKVKSAIPQSNGFGAGLTDIVDSNFDDMPDETPFD